MESLICADLPQHLDLQVVHAPGNLQQYTDLLAQDRMRTLSQLLLPRIHTSAA